MILEKYSMGIGDRFARQGEAQLEALIKAKNNGINVIPVWNKSHREHTIVKTQPESVKREADAATSSLNWDGSYYVDADHINMSNVDFFLESSNFFTLDVADFIDKPASKEDIEAFANRFKKYCGTLELPGLEENLLITEDELSRIATKYLLAIQEAGKIYRHIASKKGAENFITEVSMDETELPQTPIEMLFILAAIADEEIPAQTIAPKFTGRFNKGVDYVGDVTVFEKEFNQDLAVISFAVKEFGLPENLKLSIHSGSDKFSIYGPINKAIKKFDAGLHLKTAGTTWLEEIIGLAEAGDNGLIIAQDVYRYSYQRYDELCAPYATVIDIDKERLPSPDDVDKWSSSQFVNALRHIPDHPEYNNGLRQLLHVGYKIAAEMEERYLNALKEHKEFVSRNVTENILKRHLEIVFG